jgi:hypothetical protein
MSTWWEVNTHLYSITAREVVKETEKTLTYINPFWQDPQRAMKANQFFPTFLEARAFLLGRLDDKFNALNFELKKNKQCYDKVFLMEEPK